MSLFRVDFAGEMSTRTPDKIHPRYLLSEIVMMSSGISIFSNMQVMSYKCWAFSYNIPLACCSLSIDRMSSAIGRTLTPSYNDVPGMLFVAIFPKLAICILYAEVGVLFSHKPTLTCHIPYKSPLNSAYIFVFKLYPIADLRDMLGTNEMKGYISLHE
jgi:hypothetical protein